MVWLSLLQTSSKYYISPMQSKHTKKSHCFPPMNREHRRIIHELAQVYGIESVSYDNEPKRNVVISAVKYVVLFSCYKWQIYHLPINNIIFMFCIWINLILHWYCVNILSILCVPGILIYLCLGKISSHDHFFIENVLDYLVSLYI